MATEDFRPTHVVPQDGMPAWESPDVSRPTEPLDPLLPVQLLDRRGDWGQVLCANGWSAWVDGRLLVSVPQDPPQAGQPMARTADPRPLMARVQESLGQFRRAAEELADGRVDGETFRRRTQGLQAGMVVHGGAVWLYDAEHERWVYTDGTRLSTYAASAGPGRPSGAQAGNAAQSSGAGQEHEQERSPGPAPEATRLVSPTAFRPPEPPDTDDRGAGGPGAAEETQLLRPTEDPGPSASHPRTRPGEN
ncbi:hypothetical protein ACIQOF_09870 [Streptomyces sp. NPDC091265]|uniref:hypothetical protein n=1 Tax=unclassified Streptomyces TaxID=2593676 RepID=UPI00344FF365